MAGSTGGKRGVAACEVLPHLQTEASEPTIQLFTIDMGSRQGMVAGAALCVCVCAQQQRPHSVRLPAVPSGKQRAVGIAVWQGWPSTLAASHGALVASLTCITGAALEIYPAWG